MLKNRLYLYQNKTTLVMLEIISLKIDKQLLERRNENTNS